MLNVQNPDNQQVHSQGFYESLIVKKKQKKLLFWKTTRNEMIYEIACTFTNAMYRQHSAALGLFLAKGSAKKKKKKRKKMKVAPRSVWYSTW